MISNGQIYLPPLWYVLILRITRVFLYLYTPNYTPYYLSSGYSQKNGGATKVGSRAAVS